MHGVPSLGPKFVCVVLCCSVALCCVVLRLLCVVLCVLCQVLIFVLSTSYLCSDMSVVFTMY